MRFGVSALIILLASSLVGLRASAEERVLQLPDGESLRYTIVEADQASARPVALQLLRFLAQGDIEAAAALSNAPERRLEVLRDYRAAVGDDAFRQVYARYFDPANRVLLEAAIGPRHLVIWELGEAHRQLAGQFFVQADERFLLDDIPSPERAQLERILAAYREQRTR